MELSLPIRSKRELFGMTISQIEKELVDHKIRISCLRFKKDYIQRHLDIQRQDIINFPIEDRLQTPPIDEIMHPNYDLIEVFDQIPGHLIIDILIMITPPKFDLLQEIIPSIEEHIAIPYFKRRSETIDLYKRNTFQGLLKMVELGYDTLFYESIILDPPYRKYLDRLVR